MGLEPFSPDSTIVRDESVLRDGYQPDRLIERDTELEQYQSALKPVINGAPPKRPISTWPDWSREDTLFEMVLND